MSGRITVNGEASALASPNIADLLRARGIDPAARGVAVAVNGAVVPRRDWSLHGLESGDTIEIVKPFAGG